MSLMTPEEVIAAQKSNLETLFGMSNKAFQGWEKLVDLNMQVLRSTLAENHDNARRMLSARDPQQLLSLQASIAQPNTEKALSYNRHVYEIFATAQAELAELMQAQYDDFHSKVQAVADNMAKNAPAGSETAVAVMKSAITAANTTYETVRKTAKQAIDIAESNFNAATTAASKAAQQATQQASASAAAARSAATSTNVPATAKK